MIRKAQLEDGEAISQLILVILKDMELPLLNDIGEDKVTDLITQAYAYPTYRYGYPRGIVYEVDGKVAGAAFGYRDDEEESIDDPFLEVLAQNHLPAEYQLFTDKEVFGNEWYLDSIVTDKNYRGHGIGSKLLQALPKLAAKEDRSVIGLNVDVGNPKAKKLYTRKGFETVGQVTISGHLYDHMQWQFD